METGVTVRTKYNHLASTLGDFAVTCGDFGKFQNLAGARKKKIWNLLTN